MSLYRTFLTVSCATVLLGACAHHGPQTGVGNVRYGDAQAVETLTTDFGSTDLQQVAEKMTGSLLESPVISGTRNRPVLTLADVKNKTDEYIDTTTITEKIRIKLLKSGLVKFGVNINEMQNQVDELQRQNQSGLYKKRTRSKIGEMQASQYRLEGNVSSIIKRADGLKDVYYLFTLTLVDNESGLVEWADEKEIRKQAEY